MVFLMCYTCNFSHDPCGVSSQVFSPDTGFEPMFSTYQVDVLPDYTNRAEPVTGFEPAIDFRLLFTRQVP